MGPYHTPPSDSSSTNTGTGKTGRTDPAYAPNTHMHSQKKNNSILSRPRAPAVSTVVRRLLFATARSDGSAPRRRYARSSFTTQIPPQILSPASFSSCGDHPASTPVLPYSIRLGSGSRGGVSYHACRQVGQRSKQASHGTTQAEPPRRESE